MLLTKEQDVALSIINLLLMSYIIGLTSLVRIFKYQSGLTFLFSGRTFLYSVRTIYVDGRPFLLPEQ